MTTAALASGCSDGPDLNLQPGDSFDTVLDRLHTLDPRFGNGLSNHAPMAAEALITLGWEDRVADFVNAYAKQLEELTPAPALAPAERAASLGDGRRAAWIASYEQEILDGSARDVFSQAWPLLVSGYASEAFHCVLRSAHAIRSLEREDTPSRRRELAHGLGYWGAHYYALPGVPGSRAVAGKDVVQALAEVQIIPGASHSGLITDRLVAVEGDAGFLDSVETVDLDVWPVDVALNELASAAARLFVSGGTSNIACLHSITGTSALRLMLPWLDASQQRLGLGYAFQTVAAIHATQGSSSGVPTSVPDSGADVQTLSATAADSPDEHKIKLVEAALREYAIDPRLELLAAADAWG